MQGPDFLRAKRGDFHHGQQAGRDGGAEFFVIVELAGSDEFGDFQLQGVAETEDGSEPVFRDERGEFALVGVERAGGLGVGQGLERVFALQFEQHGDLLEDVGDLGFVHLLQTSISPSKIDGEKI